MYDDALRGRAARFRPPASDGAAWDAAADRTQAAPYLDPRVAQAKQDEHLELLQGWLPDLHGRTVLKTDLWEEGIAGDELLFTIASRAGAVIGVDVSPCVVAAARAAADRAAIAADLRVADLRSLPFADGSIDAIVSTSTIDHLAGAPEHRAAVAELARVLAPGGTLVLTADNAENGFDWLLRAANRLGAVPFPLGPSFTQSQLETLVRGAGLEPTGSAGLVPAPRVIATALTRAARLLPASAGDRAVAALLRAFRAAGRWMPRRMACFIAIRAVRPPDA